MSDSIDDHFLASVKELGAPASVVGEPEPEQALALFGAQLQSRHLDFAARWLQQQGEGFYTIGSAGHEANAAVGMLTRLDDPALLHYRSGGFYAARAGVRRQHDEEASDGVRDILLSLVSATSDPMSGGRHKVFGHPSLGIIPQTSTISSHLPRAVGLGFGIGLRRTLPTTCDFSDDSIVVTSFGDASLNHSTAQGALNAAGYLAHRGVETPVLFVCEDNGIGISTPTPNGWTASVLSALPAVEYFAAPDSRPDRLLADVARAVDHVRSTRKPAVLHLSTVRFMGHAGSDVELGYRSRKDIRADFARDPLLASARHLVETGILSPGDVLDRYEETRDAVMSAARVVVGESRLSTAEQVTGALFDAKGSTPVTAELTAAARADVWRGKLPEEQGALTLAQSINAALSDIVASRPNALVFGEDVAVKGGVYGVTRGLRRRFGGHRVFDTLLDEQTVLGTALGTSLAGFLPIPEIQYLAYLHNAEDQLRGEAASLQFFSNRQFRNPMVVRIAGLAYQKGFGGHFHNDNSVAVLRDIPGIVVCVPSHPADAPALLRECVALAESQGRVCVYLEPIALYHTRDLVEPGDETWTSDYVPPEDAMARTPLGSVRTHGDGSDALIVTFGNGVHLSRRAAHRLAGEGVGVTVMDLRWLAPLPSDELMRVAAGFDRVLVVDETRHSGGVAEAVVATLVDSGHRGDIARVTSADSFIPLGPATDAVLLREDDVIDAVHELIR